MQFLVRVFGGVDIIRGKLSYELQALDPKTDALFINTYLMAALKMIR